MYNQPSGIVAVLEQSGGRVYVTYKMLPPVFSLGCFVWWTNVVFFLFVLRQNCYDTHRRLSRYGPFQQWQSIDDRYSKLFFFVVVFRELFQLSGSIKMPTSARLFVYEGLRETTRTTTRKKKENREIHIISPLGERKKNKQTRFHQCYDLLKSFFSSASAPAHHLTRNLLPCSFIVFILCWAPYIVFDLLQVYGHIPKSKTMIAVATFIQSLAPLNSAANPLIYCLFSTHLCRNLR